MRTELESEAKQLQQDRGKQERLATTVTNQQQADAQVIADDRCNAKSTVTNQQQVDAQVIADDRCNA